MLHRLMFKGLLGLIGYSTTDGVTPASANAQRILLQTSPIAGLQYYRGENLWSVMRIDDPIDVVRESTNPHDTNAVRLDWQGRQLGYLPRVQNTAVACLLDQGKTIEASIVEMNASDMAWKTVWVGVYLVVSRFDLGRV